MGHNAQFCTAEPWVAAAGLKLVPQAGIEPDAPSGRGLADARRACAGQPGNRCTFVEPVPQAGIEPALPAPEAGALSPELLGRATIVTLRPLHSTSHHSP